jgi:hypothetical protein
MPLRAPDLVGSPKTILAGGMPIVTSSTDLPRSSATRWQFLARFRQPMRGSQHQVTHRGSDMMG